MYLCVPGISFYLLKTSTIINENHREAFEARKAAITKEVGETDGPVERELWHGTVGWRATNIYKQGYDVTLAGTVHGNWL